MRKESSSLSLPAVRQDQVQDQVQVQEQVQE